MARLLLIGTHRTDDPTRATFPSLLPKGARLSAAVVSRLAGWGVAELFVEGEGEAPEFDILVEGAEASAESSSLLAGLEERFAEWESDATMMRIKAIARRHLGG